MTKFQDNQSPYITLAESAEPSTPTAGLERVFLDVADSKLKRKDSSGAVSEVGSGGSANHGYYQYLASLLEPDAIEAIKTGAFSYPVASNVTKILTASWNTRLGSAGRMEVRNQ